MPLISTGTMGSNKSFGFSRGKPKVLTTYTFPAGSSTWTAPAGVTSLTSAIGKGSNGTPDQWIGQNFFVQSRRAGTTGTGSATLSAATITSEINTIESTINSMTASSSGAFFSGVYYIQWNFRATSGVWVRTTITAAGTYRRSGSAFTYRNHPTTGDMSTTTAYLSRIEGAQVLQAGSSGTATTGFSLTFPGGTVSVPTAVDTSFNNVTVSPGTTYTITNNGSLTITYFV